MSEVIFEIKNRGWSFAVSSNDDQFAAQVASPEGDIQTHWYDTETKARLALADAMANDNRFPEPTEATEPTTID
jgi:hypothetical protein